MNDKQTQDACSDQDGNGGERVDPVARRLCNKLRPLFAGAGNSFPLSGQEIFSHVGRGTTGSLCIS
jgi:hypothetical protein